MGGTVFVTVADLSQISGSGVATKELVVALGEESDDPLYVVCPAPESPLPSRVADSVNEFVHLPSRTNPGSPWWHLSVELRLFPALIGLLWRRRPDRVLTRLYPSALFAAPLARLNRTLHGLLIRGMVNRKDEYDSTKFSTLVERVVQMNVRLSTEVFVAYERIREWVQPYRGPQQSPVAVVPNAVDPELFAPMDRDEARSNLPAELPSDGFVVGFVGSLAPRHMLPTLLRALARMEDAHALIIGDGTQREKLESLAAELGVSRRVWFTGAVPHSEVPACLAASDVTYGVVSPKKASNPLKCYEYLACARPVLTSDVPEFSFVPETDSGLLVDEVSAGAVAEALADFERMTPEQRLAMGTRGREYVLDNHTWRNFARRLLEEMPPSV